ncbi:MAG TPA: toxin-antitoxin system HicB family antitoxin [Syntrophus sp. (in: bacteria)]|jgi:predicted HicB family RNase H-like nuclease|nr:toxin-antitoxin system HicB family antitoxin [Syntrophus sp. (in: bacteria)]
MKNILQHKGYTGNVQFDQDDMLFYGRVMGMKKAQIAYEGKTVDDLVKDFRDGIDDYLDMCVEEGREPEKPFKGTFNIRLDPELHKHLVVNALGEGMTLNAYVKSVLQRAVSEVHI